MFITVDNISGVTTVVLGLQQLRSDAKSNYLGIIKFGTCPLIQPNYLGDIFRPRGRKIVLVTFTRGHKQYAHYKTPEKM